MDSNLCQAGNEEPRLNNLTAKMVSFDSYKQKWYFDSYLVSQLLFDKSSFYNAAEG